MIDLGHAPARARTGPAPLPAWKKLLFSVVVLGGVLVVCELAIRAGAALTDRERLYRLDPVAGYTCKPNLDHMVKRYGRHLTYYSTDARGFRITAPPGAVRRGPPVYLLGDSFALGFCVDDEDALGYRLSDVTGRRVVNLSCNGYSPDTALALLREHLAGVSPGEGGDAVVLICDNDFDDISRSRNNHRPKPYFDWDGTGFVERPPQAGPLDRAMDWSNLGFLVLSHVLPAERKTGVPPDALPDLMCHVIGRIDALCAEKGVTFTALFHEHLLGARVRPHVKGRFFTACRAHGLPVAEITARIRDGADDVRELLAVDDCHWSRKGNGRVAEIIRDALTAGRPARAAD